MMKVRTAHGKFVFILFFCFGVFSVLEAAPQNGTVNVSLNVGGGDFCISGGNSASLIITAQTFFSSGSCKQNGAGPDFPFVISAT